MAEKIEKTEKKRELLEYHSPAAKLAAAKGEETKVIVIAKRYPKDNYRNICINDNPACVLPTDTEVEVALDEYYEIKNSMTLRRANERESARLEAEYRARGKYL